MVDIKVGAVSPRASAVVLPVRPGDGVGLLAAGWPLPDQVLAEVDAFLADVGHQGSPGSVHVLTRPSREPGHLILAGIGDGGEAGWRSAGAAVFRALAERLGTATVALPGTGADVAAGAFAEGAWLASYRYRLGADSGPERKLRRLTLASAFEAPGATGALRRARALVDAVMVARDLTNTPSSQKSPKWFADRMVSAAGRRGGVTVTVHDEKDLAEGGFGGVLAVGAGSTRPPRLVELSWRPRGARTHVVLVGKGICFDSGGISIKPLNAMKLMRKDMGGAAAVCATVLGAADLGLPVRVTALAPLAENLVSGSSMRPGDVIRQYGGATTEVLDTDAEGRLVLADALSYAARRLRPDYLVDLATLTGAQNVALGKRTAALFSHDPELASGLRSAGELAGEQLWPLPLADDYLGLLRSDVADLANIGLPAQAGAVVAALFLREFTGDRRERWAHIDMSAPAWSDRADGPLVKGATGWGVRLLLRWLGSL